MTLLFSQVCIRLAIDKKHKIAESFLADRGKNMHPSSLFIIHRHLK